MTATDTPVTIEKAANGFILRPAPNHHMPGMAYNPGDVHVFNHAGDLYRHLDKHFGCKETPPADGQS